MKLATSESLQGEKRSAGLLMEEEADMMNPVHARPPASACSAVTNAIRVDKRGQIIRSSGLHVAHLDRGTSRDCGQSAHSECAAVLLQEVSTHLVSDGGRVKVLI